MRERVYASTGDYGVHTGKQPPDDLDRRLLVRCSKRIDRALIGAVYAVDEDGYPTDPDVRATLRAATCAQASWCYSRGDKLGTGAVTEWTSVKIGDVQLSKGAETAAAEATGGMPLAPEAADILFGDSMLPVSAWVYG